MSLQRRQITLGLSLLLVAALTAPLHSSAGAAPADPGLADGQGLTALARLPYLDSAARVAGASSHAPVGDNFDSGPSISTDSAGNKLLLEATGPGAIDRIWMTGNSIDDFGLLSFFFDGEKTARVSMPASALFSGSHPPFQAPLCTPRSGSSGGSTCDVRMPFHDGVRVTASGTVDYYNIGYETYPAGTQVRSFDPKSAVTLQAAKAQAAVAARAGKDPGVVRAGTDHAGGATLAAGATRAIAVIPHAGTIRSISVNLGSHDDATLQNVWLQARWDGSAQPAVSAPLADLFLSGAGERSPARGLLAGYLPSSHTGYLYFPMPFARSADVRLVNHSTKAVAAHWHVQESSLRYPGVGTKVGELHATFGQTAATQTGSDYVAVNAAGQGKVVGLSFTEEGPWNDSEMFYMEGDERVYVDGSRSPAVYGTGTEDFFGGGYYYENGPFSLFDHGLTAKELGAAGTGRTSQYRLMLTDPWFFRDGLKLGIEHGGGDGLTTAVRSVVFWYGTGHRGLAQTDRIDPSSASSVKAAGYGATTATAANLKAFFEGDHDGNLSSPAFDQLQPGAQRPPPGTESVLDWTGESVTSNGLTHPVGAAIHFNVRIDRRNQGVVLRRQLDQQTFGQRAEVSVNGRPAGIWLTPGTNTSKRWADSDFTLPAALTAGKLRLAITLKILRSPNVPNGSAEGWTDFGYTVYSILG